MSFVIKEGQNALWVSDEKSRSGPLTQEKQDEKERHSSGLLLFSQSSFHGKQYWFRFYGPLCLSNAQSLRLALLLPTWPQEKALCLSIKEPLTGNHSSWSPSLAFNFYKTYQSWQRGEKSLRNISKLRLKDITLRHTSICRMSFVVLVTL